MLLQKLILILAICIPFTAEAEFDLEGETLGIEVEAQVPVNQRTAALLGIEAFLRSRFGSGVKFTKLIKDPGEYGQHAMRYGNFLLGDIFEAHIYRFEFATRGTPNSLVVSFDQTVDTIDGYSSFEISSHVIRNSQDFQLFQDILDLLNSDHGLTDAASGGGTHFHIGLVNQENQPLRPMHLAQLTKIYQDIIPELAQLLRISAKREKWIEDVPEKIRFLLEKAQDSLEAAQLVIDELSQYRGSNNYGLVPVTDHQTYEIRHMNSTVHKVLLEAVAEFHVKLFSAVRAGRIPPNPNGYSLSALSEIFDSNFWNDRERLQSLFAAELNTDLSRPRRYPLPNFARGAALVAAGSAAAAGACWYLFSGL